MGITYSVCETLAYLNPPLNPSSTTTTAWAPAGHAVFNLQQMTNPFPDAPLPPSPALIWITWIVLGTGFLLVFYCMYRFSVRSEWMRNESARLDAETRTILKSIK